MMVDLQTMKPINKTAALVASQGVNYNYLEKRSQRPFTTKMKPPIRAITKKEIMNEQFIDLTGMKYGKIEVIGRYTESERWVIRCDCGNYETRRSKAIKNKSEVDRCAQCVDIGRKRRKAFYLVNGFRNDEITKLKNRLITEEN